MEPECEAEECTKPARQGRMCYMHFHRMRYYGNTDDPRRSWQAAYWMNVTKTDACWLWTGPVDRRGYGRVFTTRAPLKAAHRLAWFLAYGADPGPLHVCHRCDNPPCVNPEHLFLGDDAANHGDMADKKRSTWGARNHHAKLTADDVREIRRLAASGVRQTEIAERFSVSRVTVSNIHCRKSWYQLD